MMPDIESTSVTSQVVKVTDTYHSVRGGRPLKLSRTFDTISLEVENPVSMEMMGDSQEIEMTGSGTSPLQGTTVDFVWDTDADGYKMSFAEGEEQDEELVEGLVEDMDFRALLPDGEISDGDTWSIPASSFTDVLFVGGNLSIEIESTGDEPPMGMPDPSKNPDPREILADVLEGEATGKFIGTREINGARVAVIEIDVSIQSMKDMSDFFTEMMEDLLPEGVDMSIDRVDMEFVLEAQGKLFWNLAGGHMHSFELDGDVTINSEEEMSVEFGGDSMSIEQSTESSGTFEYRVTTE